MYSTAHLSLQIYFPLQGWYFFLITDTWPKHYLLFNTLIPLIIFLFTHILYKHRVIILYLQSLVHTSWVYALRMVWHLEGTTLSCREPTSRPAADCVLSFCRTHTEPTALNKEWQDKTSLNSKMVSEIQYHPKVK